MALPEDFKGWNTYIGARYVPVFDGEWDATKSYEPLTVVTCQGNSYTSKTFVAAGVPVSNETYWAQTGNYNSQVEQYRQEVVALGEKFDKLEDNGAVANIKYFGAAGDGSDASAALTAALENYSHVYFPAGSYTFTNFEIPHAAHFFGEGTISPTPRDNGEQQNTIFSTYFPLHLEGLDFLAHPLPFSGVKHETTSAIMVHGSELCLTDIHVNGWNERNYIIPVPFTQRTGSFLTAWDCPAVIIQDSDFGNNGGQEFIWITSPANGFTSGNYFIHNNRFHDRTYADTSSITIIGGNIEFTGNTVYDYFNNSIEPGGSSVFNLLGMNVVINGNQITKTGAGSVFDTCEAYYIKNESVIISDNIIETSTGVGGVHVNARHCVISGNIIASKNAIQAYLTTPETAASLTQSYYADAATRFLYDDISIIGNTLISTGDLGNPQRNMCTIAQWSGAPVTTPKYGTIVIQNNTFTPVETSLSPVGITVDFSKLIISGNNFLAPGSVSWTSNKVYIGMRLTGSNTFTGALSIINNTFFNTQEVNSYIMSGGSPGVGLHGTVAQNVMPDQPSDNTSKGLVSPVSWTNVKNISNIGFRPAENS